MLKKDLSSLQKGREDLLIQIRELQTRSDIAMDLQVFFFFLSLSLYLFTCKLGLGLEKLYGIQFNRSFIPCTNRVLRINLAM